MAWFTTDWFSSHHTVRCAHKSGDVINFIIVACRIFSRLKWCKNYKNRLRLAKVIVKNKMSRFLWFSVYIKRLNLSDFIIRMLYKTVIKVISSNTTSTSAVRYCSITELALLLDENTDIELTVSLSYSASYACMYIFVCEGLYIVFWCLCSSCVLTTCQ